ncbi:hypothetical protein [Streptomyces olivaceus]|nr:hypothetical protein [Streptomyces olivaceus]
MRGPLWIELAKQDPEVFWRTHENLLAALAKVATEREHQGG